MSQSVELQLSGGKRQAALMFIFITVLIDVIAFGVIIPVLPHLIKNFSGGDDVQATHWIGVFATLFATIQFFSAPIQGALSDRFGRRPVILLSCVGLGLDFILMALAPNLWWLLVGRCISAVTSASFTTANAYIADITAPQNRAKAFGMIGAAFGVGFILGPIIGGVLGHYNLHWPFWCAAVLALCNFLYGLFVLPESHAPANRSKSFSWKKANPIGSWHLIREYPRIWGLVAVVFFANVAHYIYPTIFVIYADHRYGWGPMQVSYVLAAVGVLSVIVNMTVVHPVVKRIGETRAMLAGLLFGAVGFAVYGLAVKGWMFWLGLPISAMWAIASPAAQSLITQQVGPEVQGRLQGALSSMVSLAGIVGPFLYTTTFAFFISPAAPVQIPGAPWLLASSILVVAAIVGAYYVTHHPAKVSDQAG